MFTYSESPIFPARDLDLIAYAGLSAILGTDLNAKVCVGAGFVDVEVYSARNYSKAVSAAKRVITCEEDSWETCGKEFYIIGNGTCITVSKLDW